MEELFESIFKQGELDWLSYLIVIVSALVSGVLFSIVCYYKSNSSKSFFITTSLIPACVGLVIMLVNGNLGAGIAVAGAFSLVRFRSAPGTAKEICIIFITTAAGLAFGMGFIAYAILFMVLTGFTLWLLTKFKIFEYNNSDTKKILTVVIPENLQYEDVFKDVLTKYTKEYKLVKIKSVNMGSMFKLTYFITLNNINEEKDFIDEIRVRNANLEVGLVRQDFSQEL